MATLVVNCRISPTEYWNLTGYERDAIVAEFNRINRKTR